MNAVGSVAAVCTTISFLPQLMRVWQRRSARDILLIMFPLFSFGVGRWLVYGIGIGSAPIIAANTITLLLAMAILVLIWLAGARSTRRCSLHFFDVAEPPGARQIVVQHVDLVQTSCGYGVPLSDFKGERATLRRWAEAKGEKGIEEYWRTKNVASIDGFPTGILDLVGDEQLRPADDDPCAAPNP